jgi:hypothetical protein
MELYRNSGTLYIAKIAEAPGYLFNKKISISFLFFKLAQIQKNKFHRFNPPESNLKNCETPSLVLIWET